MSATSNTSQSPYLPTQRFFPLEGEFLQRELNNSFADISKSVNAREIGVYSQSVVATGQRFDFIPDLRTQEAKRKVIAFGAIPAPGSLSLPHGLTGFTTFTRIYGVARIASGWRPLPYATNTAGDNVELFATTTQVTINNSAVAASAIIDAIVVLEFI